MLHNTIESDLTVIGGGLAGVSAAVAAARLGKRVALINNRPVLGGNSSSEVRVWVCGATAHGNQRWARETGIVGEMVLENQYRNPEGNPVYWDDVILDTVRREENISLFLNTDVREIDVDGPVDDRTIGSVTGWTMGSEILTTFTSPLFADCTGDGLIGHLAGAQARLGKESREVFGEPWAPEHHRQEFLGSTILFYTKDVGHPVKYVPPESTIDITSTPIPHSRIIRSGDSGAHYWWVEWGGELDTVHDNERIRDELRGVILGIWDYIKNSGQFDAENLTLEWIGNVPGKREYRRLIGDYTLTQQDVQEQRSFPDTVAFGGWSIDLHPVQGMYHDGAGAVQRFPSGIFEIPYRMLYSANVRNMFMAGRNVSASHIAFGASRVMATCATMGEAVGNAASLCLDLQVGPRGLAQSHSAQLQQQLLRTDASVVGVENVDPLDYARTAQVSSSSHRMHLGVDLHQGKPWLENAEPMDLTSDVAIVAPVDSTLDVLRLWAKSTTPTALQVEVYTADKPQNVIPERLRSSRTVELPAGDWDWMDLPIEFTPDRAHHLIVVLRENPAVTVLTGEPLPPGSLMLMRGPDAEDANVDVGTDQMLLDWPTKPLRGRTVAFRAAEQPGVFAPAQATSGYQRPFGGANMWVSDPGDREPWLRLDWDEPVTAAEVRLVFDDTVDLSLNNLHHHRTPWEVMPDLVRDYTVQVSRDGRTWEELAVVHDNRQRQRVHPSGSTGAFRSLRLTVHATNGAREARVIQLRLQAPSAPSLTE